MPLQVIRGVTVDFPYDPYECQVAYMEKVLECLDKRTNALLESPTGTGKTLALLCSTLAWQQDRRRKSAYSDAPAASYQFMPVKGAQEMVTGNVPTQTIIYATRTHSQLAQVVRELKATSYAPRVAILGSREQFCVHPTVKQFTGTIQNRKCSNLTADHSCQYKNNLASYHSQNVGVNAGVMDIEDLLAVGKRDTVCPYYMMRSATDNADLILMPYNYLMDAESRKPYEMRWKDSIIIFDEAHNLESVAADSLSVEISSTLVAGCIAEADKAAKRLELQGDASTLTAPEADAKAGGPPGMRRPLASLEDLLLVKKLMLRLEDELHAFQLSGGDNSGQAIEPLKVFEIFERAGLGVANYDTQVKRLQRSIDRLMDEAGLLEKTFTPSLDSFMKAVKVIFRLGEFEAVKASLPYYAGYIKQEPAKQTRSSTGSSSSLTSPPGDKSPRLLRTLCYWCLLPGLAMEQLAKLEVRSILLTSGTLNPLDSFASELRIPFPVRLENEHVIGGEQVLVGVLGTGVGGHQLSSSFQRRGEKEYMDELGHTLVQLCSIIPSGVLVFFASYGVMDACLKCWRSSGVWSRLQAHKAPLIEPRESSQLKACIAAFDAAIASGKGAVLLAVCRGKVSEGVDFADARARAVIITGIPFPPAKDPKVELKRRHLDKPMHGRDKADAHRLKGMEWYTQQASRAVNQAVGRVIRHRHDYGAILLLDERFSQDNQKNGMSVWLRPHIKVWGGYREASTRIQDFFRRMGHSSGGGGGGGSGSAGSVELYNRPRVGAGARAPKSSQGGEGVREAVVVGEELEQDADYVEPHAIRAVVRREDAALSAANVEKFREFQAAIKRTQALQEEEEARAKGRVKEEVGKKAPTLSTALMRSNSLSQATAAASQKKAPLEKAKAAPRHVGPTRTLEVASASFGPMPHSQTLSERLGFSAQTLTQKVLGSQGGGIGAKRPRPTGLQGSIGGGRVGPLSGMARVAPSLQKSATLPTPSSSLKENIATDNDEAEGGSGEQMSVEELTGFLKQARSGIRADRYELLKGKVKALLGEHTRTLKEFQAWAPSAVELFLEAGAGVDFLTRLSSAYLPAALQSTFNSMVAVRAKRPASRPSESARPIPLPTLDAIEASQEVPPSQPSAGASKPASQGAKSGGMGGSSKRAQQMVAASSMGKKPRVPDNSMPISASQQLRRREADVYERLCKVTGRSITSSAERLLEEGAKAGSTRTCNICMETAKPILMSSCRHLACQACWEKVLAQGGKCFYKCGPVRRDELKLVVKATDERGRHATKAQI